MFRSKEMEAQRPSFSPPFSPPFSSLPSNSILLRNLAFQHDACYSSLPSRDSSGPRYVALLLFPTPLPSLSSRVHTESSSPSLFPPAFSLPSSPSRLLSSSPSRLFFCSPSRLLSSSPSRILSSYPASLLDPSSQQLDLTWKQHRWVDDLARRCFPFQRLRYRRECFDPQRSIRSCSDGREFVGIKGVCASSCESSTLEDGGWRWRDGGGKTGPSSLVARRLHSCAGLKTINF